MSDEKKSNREHSFDFELASIVGLEKAILLKNISYWVVENERRKDKQYFSNGRWWTEESLSSLAKKYPYMKRASIGRWMQELHDLGWISMVGTQGGKNKYSVGKVFILWNSGGDWEKELSQNETVTNRPKMRQVSSQNETEPIPEWDTNRPKMRRINIDLNGNSYIKGNVEFPDAIAPDLPKGTAIDDVLPEETLMTMGPKKNWPRIMATIFDQVNEEKSREIGIPHVKFNWKIKEAENFKHLKNLKDIGIIPDFETRFSQKPNDDELEKAIKAVFRLAWNYFRHIQADKGGAIHFTPESIYRSYNTLKTFKNGNSNGIKSPRNGAGAKPAETGLGRGIGLDGSPTAEWGY